MLQKQESPWNFWSRLKILGAHCGWRTCGGGVVLLQCFLFSSFSLAAAESLGKDDDDDGQRKVTLMEMISLCSSLHRLHCTLSTLHGVMTTSKLTYSHKRVVESNENIPWWFSLDDACLPICPLCLLGCYGNDFSLLLNPLYRWYMASYLHTTNLTCTRSE